MNCKELVYLLGEYLDGSMEEHLRKDLDSHIAMCDSCTNFLNTYGLALRDSKMSFEEIENLDSDGDGVSNIDEFNAGTDPTQNDYNSLPERPVILTPENYDVVSMTPQFRAIEFYDADSGDRHQKSQWQIYDELSDTQVYNIKSPSSLTTLTVPRLILDENTGYYVKVRYFDNHGGASEWSQPVMFMTDVNTEDTDGNGIPDHQELEGQYAQFKARPVP